jgi:hypothetical protein
MLETKDVDAALALGPNGHVQAFVFTKYIIRIGGWNFISEIEFPL